MATRTKIAPAKKSLFRRCLELFPHGFALFGVCVVVVFLVRLVMIPWAYHIGGQSFPNTLWGGYGRLRTNSGKDYGFYMQLGGSIWLHDKTTLRWRVNPGYAGAAWLCAAKGERYVLDVSGGAPEFSAPWLSTDGTKAFFHLRPAEGAPGSMSLDLHGEWKGRELVLEDGRTNLRPGTFKDYEALCQSKK